jgi:glycosyltransferase involved in cell wall biosynthesis
MTPEPTRCNAPLPISVCLIVKDEADRVEKSVSRFGGRVAEIIAYDSGSTDGTVALLRAMGARVVEGPWMGFAKTRQAVWAMARQDWILWLDADEVFPEETIAALGRVGQEKGIAGYKVCRQVVFEGRKIKHGDWFPDWVLRVFRKDGFTMKPRLVHESVEVNGAVSALPGVVEHHSFRSWEDLERRSQRYAELWAQQTWAEKKRGGSPGVHAAWKFFRGYILKSGWLDGGLGFKIAVHNASEVQSKYHQLQNLARAPE